MSKQPVVEVPVTLTLTLPELDHLYDALRKAYERCWDDVAASLSEEALWEIGQALR